MCVHVRKSLHVRGSVTSSSGRARVRFQWVASTGCIGREIDEIMQRRRNRETRPSWPDRGKDSFRLGRVARLARVRVPVYV